MNNTLAPRFGALLLYQNGGSVMGFPPYGATLTTDTSKYPIDAIVEPVGNEYYQDTFIARSPKVKELCEGLEDASLGRVGQLQESLAQLVNQLYQPQHTSQEFKEEHRGPDYTPNTYFQENPEAFAAAKDSLVNHVKNGFAALVKRNNGAFELNISPFDHQLGIL